MDARPVMSLTERLIQIGTSPCAYRGSIARAMPTVLLPGSALEIRAEITDIARFQDRRQHKSGDETADMRPEGGPGLGRIGIGGADELQREPHADDPHGA